MNGLARSAHWLLLAVFAATPRAMAAAKAEYYAPKLRRIARTGKPPTVWEAPPRKAGWMGQQMSAQHVEEMRGLCAAALSARFPLRDSDYVLSAEGGSVRIKAPEDIRKVAGRMLGALMVARRMELGLTVEHYALSRSAAARLDGLARADIDGPTAGWLRAEARDAKSAEVSLLGRLAAAGVAYDQFVADAAAPVPVAHLQHQAGKPREIAYLTAQRGGWFSASAAPGGPTRWHVDLRVLLAWKTEAAADQAEVAVPVGQTAVTAKASLRLPNWRSLASCGNLTVSGGRSVLLALVGASDDPSPAARGKPFEAVVLRVDDPLHGTTEGPVAFCFDGSRLNPSVVLERMREMAKEKAEAKKKQPARVRAWCGSSMMLLGDVSLRPLCLEALEELLPSNEPQRLRVLLGGAAPGEAAAVLDDKLSGRTARAWWRGKDLVSVASVAATSGRGTCQLDLQAGEVGKAAVGLGQAAASEGVTLTAGCTGAGKRRRLAVTASLGVPRAGLADVPGASVNVDRLLGLGEGFLLPAGGRAAGGAILVQQLGPVVEAESPSGTVSQYQPVPRR